MNLSLIVEDYCYFSLSEAKCLAEPQILTKYADLFSTMTLFFL